MARHAKTRTAKVLILRRIVRRLWVRVALMALLAVAASAGAMLLEGYIPEAIRARFPADASMPILTILASGMLAVSTFSLNVMVTAHHAAANQATPRAHRILLADTTTHSVLATFIGAFVYALSAIILIKAGLKDADSSVTVMAVTVVVVVLVILAMLRWIDHLSDLGSMDATLRETEAEARDSLMHTRAVPALGACPMTEQTVLPTDAVAVPAPQSGYLQYVDLPRISEAMQDDAGRLYLHVPPGRFVLEGQPIAYAHGLDEDTVRMVQSGMGLGQYRTFEQDATYGLLVLSEIASRALSPGINDPGTAIDVIARQERLLWQWATTPHEETEPRFPKVFVPALRPGTLIDSAFASTSRDGADKIEVVLRLLHALRALATGPDEDLARAATEMARRTRNHAEAALVLEEDRAAMRRAYEADGAFIPSP